MIRAIAALSLAALVLATDQRPVEASPCGGGDSGGDSDSGGSDSGGDYDSGYETASCDEVSSVHGHRQCSKFGEWDYRGRLPLRVVAGASMVRFNSSGLRHRGSAQHPDMAAPVSYSVVPESNSDGLYGGGGYAAAMFGLGSGRLRHLYVGVEFGAGGLSASPLTTTAEAGDTSVEIVSASYLSGGVLAGARVPIGSFTLRGDITFGGDAVAISTETKHGDCVVTQAHIDGRAAVRPRLSVERWLTPWLSLGVHYSTNVLSSGDSSLGLFIGGHRRAFDGAE